MGPHIKNGLQHNTLIFKYNTNVAASLCASFNQKLLHLAHAETQLTAVLLEALILDSKYGSMSNIFYFLLQYLGTNARFLQFWCICGAIHFSFLL